LAKAYEEDKQKLSELMLLLNFLEERGIITIRQVEDEETGEEYPIVGLNPDNLKSLKAEMLTS